MSGFRAFINDACHEANLDDETSYDIKLAVDYLKTNGFSEIFLLGEEVGAWSALRYMAKHKDMRVRGIALIDRSEATLKRLFREGPSVRLQPANPEVRPIVVPADRVEIQGVVVGTIRRY